ncbi:hypothetical protein KFK09_029075 [Dendrobium nobile]|uniref:Uncharacterized protein n=1 Tax=Dendrobium nobile TaxID=94219 RepID=A0A8T3A9K8_DENNO|nr:hypothetical protein KFK09_029075 [Dendrobium nobile]
MPLWGAGADGLIVLPRSHLVAAGFRSPSPDFRLVPYIPVDSKTSFFNKNVAGRKYYSLVFFGNSVGYYFSEINPG